MMCHTRLMSATIVSSLSKLELEAEGHRTSARRRHTCRRRFVVGFTGQRRALYPPMATMQQPSRTATSSTRPGASPLPRNQPVQVNTQTKVIDTVAGRILCIADVRGRLSSLNDLAREANAKAIIHTGDFGFFGKRTFQFEDTMFYSVGYGGCLIL